MQVGLRARSLTWIAEGALTGLATLLTYFLSMFHMRVDDMVSYIEGCWY